MASIGSMIKSAKMGKDYIITPRLKKFLSENPNLVLDDWVADIIRDLITKRQRDRSGSFSSSASGQCPRRQILGYLGAPVSSPPDPQTQQIFLDGTWRHLRWQATLLQAGIIERVEIGLPWEAMQSMGSMDGAGVVPGDHSVGQWRGLEFGWELKGVNTFQYKKMLEPPDKFLDQINRYFLSGGFDLFVLIAEDKSCVPVTSRCLTRNGWTYPHNLRAGDELLTYNPVTRNMEWEPYKTHKVFHEESGLMRVGNKFQSFLTTPNHRWATYGHTGKLSVRRTDELNSNCWIPFAGSYNQTDSVLTPEEAEILGWVAGDGTIKNLNGYLYYIISVAKKRKIEALDHLPLHRSGPYEKNLKPIRQKGTGRIIQPRLKDYYHYNVVGATRDKFRDLLTSKDDLVGIIPRLSNEALERFVAGAMASDGSWATTGRKLQFTQKHEAVREAVQIAYTLLGIRMNLNAGKMSAYPGTWEYMHITTPPTYEAYEGDVWCPVTTNGFWLMEQDGKAIITGNSQEWREWVITPDPERIDRQRKELVMLNELANTHTLPVMKPGCVDHTDPDWKRGFCQYSGNGGTCISADTWEDVDHG